MGLDGSGRGRALRRGQPGRYRPRPVLSGLLAIAAIGCGTAALADWIALWASGDLVVPGLGLAVLAIVLSVIAFLLAPAGRRPGRYLALAGLVTGALGVVVPVVMIGIMLFLALRSESRGL